LFAAAICHAGIAALPDGTPALKGLPVRAWSDATASVPDELLTVAGLGVIVSVDDVLSAGVALVLELLAGALPAAEFVGGRRP
jgi:hypothetical protein